MFAGEVPLAYITGTKNFSHLYLVIRKMSILLVKGGDLYDNHNKFSYDKLPSILV